MELIEGIKEYIPKQELLEWLNLKKSSTQDRYVRQAFEEVISKVEKLQKQGS